MYGPIFVTYIKNKQKKKKKKKKKTYSFFLRISFFRISKERNLKERTKHAYIRTNGFFLSKRISKERQTNFERTLFDQTTYPDISLSFDYFYLQVLVGWVNRKIHTK